MSGVLDSDNVATHCGNGVRYVVYDRRKIDNALTHQNYLQNNTGWAGHILS
jgi:hypothetical protein